MTIKERARVIRKATPNGDTLRNLWDMQNRLCDLCGHEIQDLALAALDHSIPVIWFARSPLPLEDAIAQATHPKNLRCAHFLGNYIVNSLASINSILLVA